MKRAIPIRTLFLDIGGVLLTDGWDAGKRAAPTFKLEWADMEDRHRLTFVGGIPEPDGFLRGATVHPGSGSGLHVRAIESYPEMIELIAQLKARHGLKIAVVRNEGRELNAYRIRTFKLDGFADSFISSCLLSTIMAGAAMSLETEI